MNRVSNIPENIDEIQRKLLAPYKEEPLRHVSTSVTFFKFVQISEPDKLLAEIKPTIDSICASFNVKGTIVFAKEGFNGQLCIPTVKLSSFVRSLRSTNSIFLDIPDLINYGTTHNYDLRSTIPYPYKRLIIRTKQNILTDGLPDSVANDLDWNDGGEEVEPEVWHELLANKTSEKTLVLDCRNDYESDMGSFQGSTYLNTSTFSETWSKLDELLDGVPPDTKLLTFCTGGIRCYKVNAYLKQKKGYKNIVKLKKGIVAYQRWVDSNGEASLFNGNNFVFDRRRLGENDNNENNS